MGMSDTDLLRELEPTVEQNLNRHLSVAKDWMPHDYVPWSQARDFAGEDGVLWDVEQSVLSAEVRAAFEVNLLTEDNLPSYHHAIATTFSRDGAWGSWVGRWTAEEGRHAMVIRDYLLATRGVDPDALENDRMATMQTGYWAEDKDTLRGLAYVSFQELATRIAHRNTGRHSDDEKGNRLLARIAADENLHMIFYRDMVRAGLELVPDQTMVAITAEVVGFQMPGTGIPGFTRKGVRIADAGIYDTRVHRDEVIAPVLRHWGVLDMTFSTPEGEKAQAELAAHMDSLEELAQRHEARRAAKAERSAKRASAE